MTKGAPTVEVLDAADAEDRQRRVAGALRARGCGVGDRVAFCLPSSADLICAVLGAARSGVIPVLLNATLTTSERDLLVADAQPTLVVLDRAAAVAPVGRAAGGAGALPVDPADALHVGHHRTAQGRDHGMWDERTARAVFEDEAAVWQFDPDDLHLVCSPMYHTVSVRFCAGTLLSGGSLAILSRFEASTALDVLRRLRPTTAFLVPTHLQRILQAPELGPDEVFDSLRLLAHAGAPCPPSVKRAIMERVRPGACGSSTGRPRPSSRSADPTNGWPTPGRWDGPGRAGGCSSGPTSDGDGVSDGGSDGDGSGTIWCDMPDFARFSYWRDEEATRAGLAGCGLHRGRSGPAG